MSNHAVMICKIGLKGAQLMELTTKERNLLHISQELAARPESGIWVWWISIPFFAIGVSLTLHDELDSLSGWGLMVMIVGLFAMAMFLNRSRYETFRLLGKIYHDREFNQ